MVDMLHFIAILMVFVAADGTILQAILYQNSPLGWSRIIGSIFKKAIFQIDGEHFFEELDGKRQCSGIQIGTHSLKKDIPNAKLLLVYKLYLTNHCDLYVMH